MKKILFVLWFVALLFAACLPAPAEPTQDVEAIVQATFQALTLQAPTQEPAAQTGGISGQLSFPSQGIPPLLVVAFDVNTYKYYFVLTEQNQSTYQIDNIPPGTYHVFAYLLDDDGSYVGAYNQFYLCGLSVDCTDLTLVDVVVQAGAITQNINPGDWYNSTSATYPARPSINGNPDEYTPFPPITSGSIAGNLSYPSNFIPAQTIVAFDVNSQSYYYVMTAENQSTYQIDNLPPGNYYVVTYLQDGSLSAGYSQAVLCGLSAECTNHSLVPVQVTSGNVTNNINPQDWYAPPNSFPASPLP
ncbi:MAG: hypothetical protein JNJ43_00485 [Anaerolineales bacterium]|nr:hypothetical protein [Anaerolineales bacterium]